MGILCDFFIADGATVPNYDVGQEFDDADKCECKGLTALEWAQFLTILRGQEYSVDLDSVKGKSDYNGSTVLKTFQAIENQFQPKLKVMNAIIVTIYYLVCELIEIGIFVSRN
jgi:hypothetical protein